MPRLVGKARSVELSLMGERLPAEKVLEWGLVNRVYDDAALMDETMKLARELADGPTIALSLIRRLYWESSDNSFEDQLDLEQQMQRRPARRKISRRASPPSSRSVRRNSRANDGGRVGRCVASWCRGATGVTGAKTLRRRQPGNVVVRYHPSRRQYRRDPAPRRRLWCGAFAGRGARCRGSADATAWRPACRRRGCCMCCSRGTGSVPASSCSAWKVKPSRARFCATRSSQALVRYWRPARQGRGRHPRIATGEIAKPSRHDGRERNCRARTRLPQF